MRVFDAHATADRLPGAAFLAALRQRLPEAASSAALQHFLPLDASPDGARLLLSATGVPGRRLLMKTASRAAVGTLRGQALLFDGDGTPLAQFDAAALGAAATAALTALAAERRAPEGAARLALLGDGALARALPVALQLVRPLREIVVWSPDAGAAQALADELADAGFAARTAGSEQEAVAGAPLVVAAGEAPPLRAEWLAPQAFVAQPGAAPPDADTALAELVAAEAIVDAPVRPKPVRFHWEDFPAGLVRECGRVRVRRDAILAFAQQFDPQPFHLDDDAAARSLFGKLSASGWHTCAMAMRLMCESYLLESASLGSPGIENLRWLRPVLADDVLCLRMTVLSARPMASKPGVGLTRHLWELRNQHGETVLSMEGWGMMGRRAPAAA